jgi:hypothetical protein
MGKPAGGGAGDGRGPRHRQAIAELFAAEGARVACTARALAEGEHKLLAGSLARTVERIRAAGGEALAIPCDVSQWESCERAVAEVRSRFGPLDVLVNNAALTDFIPIADDPLAKWHRSFAVDVPAPFYLSKLALEDMRSRRSGAIVKSQRRGDRTRARPYSAEVQRYLRGATLLRRREGHDRTLHAGTRRRGLRGWRVRHVCESVAGRGDAGGRSPSPGRGRGRPARRAGRVHGARRAPPRRRARRLRLLADLSSKRLMLLGAGARAGWLRQRRCATAASPVRRRASRRGIPRVAAPAASSAANRWARRLGSLQEAMHRRSCSTYERGSTVLANL